MSLPKGWTYTRLDDLAKRGTGHTPDKEVPENWGGEIPWVGLQDSWRLNQVFISETTAKITERGIAKSSAVLHPRGVVILSRDAGVGLPAVAGIPIAVSQHFVVWECSQKLNNLFLYYWLQSLKKEFERVANGSTIKTIGLPYFEKLRIPLPPLPEQIEIARILGIWDAAIGDTKQLIAAKTQHKRALMQQLLTGERRFAEFNGRAWKTRKLSEFFSEKSERNLNNAVTEVLSCTKKGIVRQSERFGKRLAADDVSRYKVVREGDLVFDPMLLWDASIGFVKSIEEGVVSPAYSTFSFEEDPSWLSYFETLFQSHEMRERYKLISQGTNQRRKKAPAEAFLSSTIPLPPTLAEQRRIADVLDAATREIELLQLQLDALKTQKRGLMQLLLSGEKRVALADGGNLDGAAPTEEKRGL